MLKIVKFDLKNLIKNPTLVLSTTALPVILIILMGIVTKNKFGSSDIDSFDYYGLNMLIFSVALIAMVASNTFLEDRVIKGNMRISFAPISKFKIYFSKLIATFILGFCSYSLILIVGQYMFGINYGGKNIGYIIILLNVLSFFCCSFGIMACCIFKSEEKANAFLQLPIAIFLFFSGVFFGIHRAGVVVKTISNISPVKWIYDCSVKIIYGNDFSLCIPVLGILLLLSIVFIFISHITYKPEDYV